MLRTHLVCTLASLLLIAGGQELEAADDPQFTPEEATAAEYCTQTGGQVYWRQPTYGTNGPISQQLPLAAKKPFCQYTSASDGSRISLFLATLTTTNPTLAALAYYAEVPSGSCSGNPASCYCSLLGGSDLFGGINAAGGGWVNLSTVDQTLESCIFPDLSTIDSFGLFYHSAGIIRGIDLSKVLRYKNPALKQ